MTSIGMRRAKASKRKSCESICNKKCKKSKMSHRPLTEHARKVVEQSDLSNMSRQALEGIVKLEKSAQGILKTHIDEIVRFLLEQLKWYDDGLDMGDESMFEF